MHICKKQGLSIFSVISGLLIVSTSWADPPIGIPTATPASIVTGIPTAITVTSKIIHSAFIPTSISLQRVDAGGNVINTLGRLHDDGTQGDKTNDDKLYSIQYIFNEITPGTLRLRVSAVMKGAAKRVDSSIVKIDVLPNKIPIANAGTNQSVNVGTKTKLDGTASYDPEGQTLTFLWAITKQPIASQAALENANTSTPAFIPDQPGDYELSLIVNDGINNSAAAHVTVTAQTLHLPPNIAITAPINGTILAVTDPLIVNASFIDTGSGINSSSAGLLIDGNNVVANATVTSAGISYTAANPLFEGNHTIEISVENNYGERTVQLGSFITRSLPTIVDVAPNNVATTNLVPTIFVRYTDIGSGINLNTVHLLLDGIDVTAQSTVTEKDLNYTPTAALAAGEHNATILLNDNAGNPTSYSWAFKILMLPQPPVAPGSLSHLRSPGKIPVTAP